MSKVGKGRGAGNDSINFQTGEVAGLEAYMFADRVKERLQSLGLRGHRIPKLEEEHEGIYHDLEPGEIPVLF